MAEKAVEKAESKVEKVAENVHKHRNEILMILGLVGIFLLVIFLLRNYRLTRASEKTKE
jgi:uncharacterized membrane protein YidH (DUF202 family)